MKNTVFRGYVAELYVRLELAKLGMRTMNIEDAFGGYDLLAENGARIEVKSSALLKATDKRRTNLNQREFWSFTNSRPKPEYKEGMIIRKGFARKEIFCDFFVLICMDRERKKVVKTFIVPAKVIGRRLAITIPKDFSNPSKFSMEEYQDKWDLITKMTYLRC